MRRLKEQVLIPASTAQRSCATRARNSAFVLAAGAATRPGAPIIRAASDRRENHASHSRNGCFSRVSSAFKREAQRHAF